MKFRRYALDEGLSKEVKDLLDFIIKNKEYCEYEHHIHPLWDSIAQQKFKADTGYYPDIRHGNFSVSNIGWEFKGGRYKDYDAALADFKEFTKNVAESPQELKEKNEFKSLLEFAQWKAGNKITGISDYNLGSFFRFLRYIILGKLDKNLAQGNAIEDTLRVKSGFTNAVPSAFPFTKIPELKNLEIKRFKNGAFQIKGMSNKDIAEAQRVMKLVSRY